MRKRLMVGLVAGALVAAMVPRVASASDPGCPPGGNNIPKPVADNMGDGEQFQYWLSGWVLDEAWKPIPGIDRGNGIDKNGDDLICIRFALGVTKKAQARPDIQPPFNAFVAKDNKLPK